MYFKASIPIAGPIVLVIPALQYDHKGAPPALLLDQIFNTVYTNPRHSINNYSILAPILKIIREKKGEMRD